MFTWKLLAGQLRWLGDCSLRWCHQDGSTGSEGYQHDWGLGQRNPSQESYTSWAYWWNFCNIRVRASTINHLLQGSCLLLIPPLLVDSASGGCLRTSFRCGSGLVFLSFLKKSFWQEAGEQACGCEGGATPMLSQHECGGLAQKPGSASGFSYPNWSCWCHLALKRHSPSQS